MKKAFKNILLGMMGVACIATLAACGGKKPDTKPSVWDGTIPGWQAPNLSAEEIVKNRPKSYKVTNDAQGNPVTVEINDAAAFAWFAYRSVIGVHGFEGVTVKLNRDIDLNNKMWIPIGLGARTNSPRMPFKGTFDGQGHTIYNLSTGALNEHIKYGEYKQYEGAETEHGYYIQYTNNLGKNPVNVNIPFDVKENDDDLDEVTYGLFGVTENATIKNLNIEGVAIDVSPLQFQDDRNSETRTLIGDCVGAVVGFARGSTTIENCTVGKANHGDNIGYIRGGTCEGGIVGRVYAGTDHNEVSTRPNQPGKNQPFGTISLKNCTNNLDIKVADIKSDKIGGIVGYTQFFTTLNIENCVNNGKIEGNGYTAGIVGYRAGVDMPASYGYTEDARISHTTITGCVNNGEIVANQYQKKECFVGGIVGYRTTSNNYPASNESDFLLKDCTNNGKITVNSTGDKVSNVYAGGMIGRMMIRGVQGKVENCANSGEITVDENTATTIRVGALIGQLDLTNAATNSGKLEVKSSSNTANIVVKNGDNITHNAENLCIGEVAGKTEDKERLVLTGTQEDPALKNSGEFQVVAA